MNRVDRQFVFSGTMAIASMFAILVLYYFLNGFMPGWDNFLMKKYGLSSSDWDGVLWIVYLVIGLTTFMTFLMLTHILWKEKQESGVGKSKNKRKNRYDLILGISVVLGAIAIVLSIWGYGFLEKRYDLFAVPAEKLPLMKELAERYKRELPSPGTIFVMDDGKIYIMTGKEPMDLLTITSLVVLFKKTAAYYPPDVVGKKRKERIFLLELYALGEKKVPPDWKNKIP